MRDLTAQERQLLQDISERGGSVCPGREIVSQFSKQGRKSLRQMADMGFLTVEDTDDGPRYHLTSLGQEEANG